MIVCALYCVIVLGNVHVIDSREKCGDRCCSHYYREKESCIACPNGTMRVDSDDQNTCQPCYEGEYGYRCTEHCKCNRTTHMCDPSTGRCCCRQNSTVCVEDVSCSSKGDHERQTTATTEVDPVTNYWLLVAVLCGVVVLATTVIFFIQIWIYKSRRVGHIEIPLNDIVNITNDADNTYDDINENMMVNLQISPMGNMTHKSLILTSDYSGSGSTDACTGEKIDVYKNPYTPLTEDSQNHTHVYGDGDDLNRDLDNGSYLNPYQPLTDEWQKHTHVYDQGII